MAAVKFPFYVNSGCSIYVHQQTVVISISGKDIEPETKTLGTFTEDLFALTGWLSLRRN